MKRIYENLIEQHIERYTQMVFLAGPRQVGKTTIGMTLKALAGQFIYLNWDNQDHQRLIIEGPTAVFGAQKLSVDSPILIFDEIHKYKSWKTFLKGFFDTYKNQLRIVVTGSSKLDVYRKGGDSLMGRYFPYRIHPFSIAECLRTTVTENEISAPAKIPPKIFQALLEFGGFPEPFLNRDKRFDRRWKLLRREQLFRGDIRDASRIQEIAQLEMLADLLRHQAGQLVNYSNLATKVRVAVDTVRRWIKTLNAFYYCFTIKPWSKNISRSLIKEPKIYLWDWSEVQDIGQRRENFVASHLLKAVHFWADQGLGEYDLFFLRDKEKREVDFLVTKNNEPWFLVEVKSSENTGMSKNLWVFQQQTQAKHAFQAVFDMEYVDKDCFTHFEPIIVPVQTLLSQLI